MIKPAVKNSSYFCMPANYFWRWAEHGNIIEWNNGITICYSEDVTTLLKALTNSGVPSFGAVLLVLAACNDNWKSSEYAPILHGLKSSILRSGDDSDDDVMDYYINQALKCLDVIAALPKELRSGMRRAHLLHEVFKDVKYELNEDALRGAVDELNSGQLDHLILRSEMIISREQYKQDLECLVRIFHTYPSANKLEQQLRTGIFRMPAPVPIELPEEKPAGLWEALAADPSTAGIAQLAKHIVAALNIPMHAAGSSDQPFGGISDITNRGNYDKLLLSELANDDHILLARLANNEALYLRREEPPHNPKDKRVMLVDATIKMWGIPRVFAMSAAIACTVNIKHGESTETTMLCGDKIVQANTTSYKGVTTALEVMDHSLHCFKALDDYCSSVKSCRTTETFFITRSEALHEIPLQKLLADHHHAINFILSVSRDGEMQLHEVIKGHVKLLSKAKFNLDDILFPAKPTKSQKKNNKTAYDLPAFAHQSQSPLLFSAALLRITKEKCFYHVKAGAFGITDNFRLLHWSAKTKGAVELLQYVEQGSYSFGFDDHNKLYLLINRSASLKNILYTFHLINGLENRKEVDINGIVQAAYKDGYFYVKTSSDKHPVITIINCKSGTIESIEPFIIYDYVFDSDQQPGDFHINHIKKYANNGYNVLQRFNAVAINTDGNISLNNKALIAPTVQHPHFTFQSIDHVFKHAAVKTEENYTLPSNEHCKLTYFTWQDGSSAIIDARGFVHLISADKRLQEISVILVQNKTTACWASDGTVSGNAYFIPDKPVDHLQPDIFYKKYIRPFINQIMKHGH